MVPLTTREAREADDRTKPVFHRHGARIKNFRAAFATACTAAGCPGRLLHDFRRTAVRNLERDGVSRSAAMAMVGHKTEAIYHRYAIVDAGALRDAAAKIDRAAGVGKAVRRGHGHTFGHTNADETLRAGSPVSESADLLRKVVPEEGIEPSRGVNPTGF